METSASTLRGILGPQYCVAFHLTLCSLQSTGRVTNCPGLPGTEDPPSTGTFSAKTGAVGDPLHSPGAALKLSLFSKHGYLPQICPHPAHLELLLEHLSPPEVNALSQLLTDPANPCGL